MSYFSDMMADYFNSSQPADPYAAPTDITPPPGYGGLTRAGNSYDEPLSTKLGRLWRNDRAPPPIPGAADLPLPPPPIPGPADMPRQNGPVRMPVTPRFEQGGASARVLADLAKGPKNPASDMGINLLPGGQQHGEYADFLARLAAQQPAAAAGGGAVQGAMPGLSNAPPAAPAAPAAPQSARPAAQPTGSGIESHIAEMRRNPLFQYAPPASQQPDFHDKLLRFGLAAMAAGGKPMATTLGALGEAGLSTVDASQKAKQTDFENTLNNRKLGVAAQKQISEAYEKVDMLRQRAESATATAEDRRAYQAAQQELQRWQIALTAQGRQDSNETRQDANRIREDDVTGRADARQEANRIHEGDLAGKAEDRKVAAANAAARTAETVNQHAADAYRRDIEAANKRSITGSASPEEELKILRNTAGGHKGSVYEAQWEAKKATALDDARRFIAANPAEKPKAVEMLRRSGIDPREL